ncbi:MAG: MATE family efflux transporter [Candidatus Gastranaerophilales bacterium]|nr:MATE family efflux transporter [Candidatus Gastranaerophilales bacterium]
MNKPNEFTEGKIVRPLIGFALPILLALCLQSLYGAVDLLVVGRFGTSADVSAVATGSQMMLMVTAIITGFAMGTTILLGQAIGRKHDSDAGDIIGSSICFFFALAMGITAIMLFIVQPFTTLMHAPVEAFSKTVGYVRVCSAGTVFIVAYNVLGSISRGLGDSKTPMLTVAVACVFNIVGDLLFVGVFDLKAEGAALATVLAQCFSVILCLLIVRKRGLPFPFGKRNIRFHKMIIGKIVRIGLPIALQDGLVNISFLAINSIVNTLGVTASAGVGVAEKICAFIMLVPSAFSQSLSAFVAQNIGAGKKERARRSMLCGMCASLMAGMIMAYLAFFHGGILAGIFAKEESVILAAADYLKAYAIDTLIVSFLFCYIGYFNGCGKTTFVMLQGIIGAFGVRIPVSYFISKTAGVTLFQIGLATPASTIVQIILCSVFFVFRLYREKSGTTNC